MSFISDKFAILLPPKYTFKNIFKCFFEFMLVQERVSEVLKMWYFPYPAFWLVSQWGVELQPPPVGFSYPNDSGKLLHWIVKKKN